MTPTLLLGEHFEADLAAYESRAPAVGDVVVFPVARGSGGAIFSRDQRPDLPTDFFFKRVIGSPGDVIEFRDGRVYRNGGKVSEVSTGRTQPTCSGHDPTIYKSSVGGHEFEIARDSAQPEPAGPRVEVPEGRLYVLGDYRNRSNDSRIWGTVAIADVTGKAVRITGGEAPGNCPALADRAGTPVH
jgi:signal peptidase I